MLDSEARKEALAAELLERELKRKEFSRRRTTNKEADINFINERNEVFNKKLERNFGKSAAEIKANLERGTAL